MSDAELDAPVSDPVLDLPPSVFVKKMEPYELALITLKDLLYEGSWDRVGADLRAARENRPHIYRLSNAIDRDLKAIERLKAYEEKHRVNLSSLLKQR